MQPFIASWMTYIWSTAAKLTCPCNMLRTLNSFARSDTGVQIDSEPHPSRTCKASILCLSHWAVRVHTGCCPFPFYTPTKPLIQLHIKYKTVLFPKLKMISLLKILIIKCKYMQYIQFLECPWNHEYFGSLAKLTWRDSLTLQETRCNHDSMNIPKIEFISWIKKVSFF